MNTEHQIEFNKVKEMWMECAVTDWTKEQIKDMRFYLEEGELRRQLKNTTDSRALMEKLGTPPLQSVDEMRDILMAAEKGDCLTPYQLERVEKVLVAVRRLRDYLERGKMYDNPLAYYGEDLRGAEELEEEIRSQIRGGQVEDRASRELFQIRGQMIQCEEKMKQKADQILRSNKECMTDQYTTLRNGRVCVPVKKEYKFKIAGSVMDQSATGSTLFIEPAGVGKYYEELELLRIGEENEVHRILYTLTGMVADASKEIRESMERMEKLDFIFSKGKLSMDLDGTEPAVNTARRIVLKDARHPLMEKGIHVPLQFEIGEDIRGIVITGPNTGGKTVAIKTVMLNCMMAQCGLHVTCSQANICMNNSFLCDIGDGQNIAENLSTFSAHIKNVLEVLEEANPGSLVILDELGSGTDPAEGMGIAIAILEELRKSGAVFLVTTHYPEVKEYANQAEGILNARMTFDRETLRPTYQMVIGEAGESCAFYIADRLGMPNEMLRVAIQAAYGEEAVNTYHFQKEDSILRKKHVRGISKARKRKDNKTFREKYKRGDSVMVYPDKKLGIVCVPVNEKGVLQIQLLGKKIWINHKRVKLHVAAEELYPDDYDFSIIFESVQERKIHHDMQRKYTEVILVHDEEHG